MRALACLAAVALLAPSALAPSALAQAVSKPPAGPPPTLAQVRQGMGIPSTGDVRGQQDVVGFASNADQMARTWELSAAGPAPERLGTPPAPGVAAILAPHDDYLYAGRSYRAVVPLLTAKTVVMVGVFHKWRAFGARDRLVFDSYRAWRAPDGEIAVSPLREELLAGLDPADVAREPAMQDAEHSLEAVAYWLRHQRPDVQIVPIIVPASSFARLDELAAKVGRALAAAVKKHGWTWGRDVALAISTDGVHYGPDFEHTPFGQGGIEAYAKAVENDRRVLTTLVAGPLTTPRLKALYETFVDPADPARYRLTWCGRFAVPFGMLLLQHAAADLGLGTPVGHAVGYATSVGWPELPLKEVGMGATAPDSLYHFVGYPTAAFTLP